MATGTALINRRSVLLGMAATAASAGKLLARPVSTTQAKSLLTAAEKQVGVTTVYDPAYVRLAFPGGDVPRDRGVCTDVVVRAYRDAFGYDLQLKLNADMRVAFASYPRRWGLAAPDTNIDHRRVPNLQTFFARQGAEKPKPARPTDWQPGDIVSQMIPGNKPHIGIIAAAMNAAVDRPLVIHNIGRGTQIEDILDLFPVTGCYRFYPVV
jgi:uncharacterized protein